MIENLRLPKALKIRKDIPFFCEKTEADFKNDKYENYAQVVTRQLHLHLADDFWDAYPFQPILDWILTKIEQPKPSKILDIGCSVGRLIGEIATNYPNSECWGIDYSYQLLRQAQDYWVKEKTLHLDGSNKGLDSIQLVGKNLPNLHFGLAKGEALPFENNVLDLICSSFTIDRFDDVILAFQEMYRVLKSGGQALLVSPLNFQKKEHWSQFYPVENLLVEIQKIGFKIVHFDDAIRVDEPLDKRGNCVCWNCIGVNLIKN